MFDIRALLLAVLTKCPPKHITCLLAYSIQRTYRHAAIAIYGLETAFPCADLDELVRDLKVIREMDTIGGLISREWPANPGKASQLLEVEWSARTHMGTPAVTDSMTLLWPP